MNSVRIDARWWRKPAARISVKALIGLSLIALLCWRLDFHAITRAFARFSWPYLLTALMLFLCSWPIAAARWRLFAPRFPFRHLLVLNLIGQFYAVVLPGQIAGEAVKAYRLAKGNADAERLAASVAMDRLVGTIALLLVAVVGIALTPHALPESLRALLIGLSILLVAGLFMFRVPTIYRITQKAIVEILPARMQQLTTTLRRLIDAWRDFSNAPWRIAASLLLGIVLQMIALGMYATLAANLGIVISVADWLWVIAVTSLAVLLPLSIGGIGLREGALVGCLGYLGVAGEPAIVLSIGIFAITLSGAFAGGILEVIQKRARPATSSTKTADRDVHR